jgi:hypothetical protein
VQAPRGNHLAWIEEPNVASNVLPSDWVFLMNDDSETAAKLDMAAREIEALLHPHTAQSATTRPTPLAPPLPPAEIEFDRNGILGLDRKPASYEVVVEVIHPSSGKGDREFLENFDFDPAVSAAEKMRLRKYPVASFHTPPMGEAT